MAEQALGYGIPILNPNDMYTEANVQARWHEHLRPLYGQQVVDQTARGIFANRERLKLVPLWRSKIVPEKGLLDGTA